jgi:hypothetical protein
MENAPEMKNVTEASPEADMSFQILASWLCPVLTWGSQILFAVLLGGQRDPGMAMVCFVLMLVQGLLLIAGTFFGVMVMMNQPKKLPLGRRLLVLAGLSVSLLTIGLIASLFIAQS